MSAGRRIYPLPGILAASTIVASVLPSALAQSPADTVGPAFNWSILFLIAAPYTIAGVVGGWLFFRYWRGSGSVLPIFGHAFRLRCPRCGDGALSSGWFAMYPRCAACGLRYEREQGYFVGAIYVNYAVTVGVAAGTVLLVDEVIGLSLTAQLVLGVTLAALVPLAFFRYARSLWLSLGYLVSRADERREQARRGSR